MVRIKCKYCNKKKWANHFYWRSNGNIKGYKCKKCESKGIDELFKVPLAKVVIRRREFIIFHVPQKDSEYHRNYQRTDTNPAFFKHLCSGSSLEFQ